MIRLIVFLVIAVGLSWLGAWLADNPGQVSLTWQGVQIETSFAVFVVGVLLLSVVLTAAFEVVRLLRGAPKRFIRHRRHLRTERGYEALSQGLVAAAAGDTATAKSLNRRAEKLLDHAPSTLMLSAQTAQLEGDEGVAQVKFQRMLGHRETEFLGLRGMLAQAIKDGDTDTALKLARRAYLRRPNTPWVLTTLFDLQTQAGLWTEALSTVGDMARYKLIDRTAATRRRAILFHQAAAEKRAAGRTYEALELAQKAHRLLPGLAPIAVQTSTLADEANKPRVARKIIETSWRTKPHPSLAKALLDLAEEQSPAERFKLVERLHQLYPNQLDAELTLAAAAIAAERWQDARAALERALKLGPTASAYRLLAELEQAEGGDGEKARIWLAKAVDAPPDPAWLCETTGAVSASWSAFGPDGRFDSLHWGSPPKIVPLLDEDAPATLILPREVGPTEAKDVPPPTETKTEVAMPGKVDAA